MPDMIEHVVTVVEVITRVVNEFLEDPDDEHEYELQRAGHFDAPFCPACRSLITGGLSAEMVEHIERDFSAEGREAVRKAICLAMAWSVPVAFEVGEPASGHEIGASRPPRVWLDAPVRVLLHLPTEVRVTA